MATLDELLFHQPQPRVGIDDIYVENSGGGGIFLKNLFKSLIQGTRASNAIPAGGGLGNGEASDFAFHAATSSNFADKSLDTSKETLALLKKLVDYISKTGAKDQDESKQEEEEEALIAGLDDVEDPDAFENLADLIEDLLDHVEYFLSTAKRGEGEGIKEAGDQEENKKLASEWARLRRMAGAARQTASRYNTMLSQTLDIPKPQHAFQDEIDNRRETCFRPCPHGDGKSVEGGNASEIPHPCETEIRNFTYSTWQLQVPAENDMQVPLSLQESSPAGLVASPEALRGMVQSIREELEKEDEKAIAVDLEAHSLRSFQGLVCLMQISTRERDFLVDTLALRREVGPLLHDLFTDHTVLKIFHGAESDIKWLQRDFGLYVVNLFDTFVAAQALHMPKKSLAYLLQHYVGVVLDKQYQLADWRVRPLPEKMLHYAREDTHYLLHLHDCLRRDLGREQGRIQEVLEGSQAVSLLRYRKETFDPEGYGRLLQGPRRWTGERGEGGREGGLAPVQRETLKALYDWRDRVAREEDESPGYVCPDKLLLRLAKVRPLTRGEVQECVGSGSALPPLVGARMEDMLQVVGAAGKKDGEEEDKARVFSAGGGASSLGDGGTQRRVNTRTSESKATATTVHADAEKTPLSDYAFPVYVPAPLEDSLSQERVSSTIHPPPTLPLPPVLNMEELYLSAGWTVASDGLMSMTPVSTGAGREGGRAGVVAATGNEGLESHRGLQHSIGLSARVRSSNVEEASAPTLQAGVEEREGGREGGGKCTEGDAQGPYATALDPLAGARALLRKEQGLPPVNNAEVDFDGDSEEEEEEKGECEEEGEADEEAMPRSIADIYRISNRNRRRNKEKKRQQDTRSEMSAGADGGAGEGVEGPARLGTTRSSSPTPGDTSLSLPLDPELHEYFGDALDNAASPVPLSHEGVSVLTNKRTRPEDTEEIVKFMSSIGWVDANAPALPSSSRAVALPEQFLLPRQALLQSQVQPPNPHTGAHQPQQDPYHCRRGTLNHDTQHAQFEAPRLKGDGGEGDHGGFGLPPPDSAAWSRQQHLWPEQPPYVQQQQCGGRGRGSKTVGPPRGALVDGTGAGGVRGRDGLSSTQNFHINKAAVESSRGPHGAPSPPSYNASSMNTKAYPHQQALRQPMESSSRPPSLAPPIGLNLNTQQKLRSQQLRYQEHRQQHQPQHQQHLPPQQFHK